MAALLVLWAHAAEIFAQLGLGYVGIAQVAGLPPTGLWLQELSHHFDFGRIGVVVFFATSGFVVPASLTSTRFAGLRRFAISRTFRLFPAFWLSIVPGACAYYWLWGKSFSLHDLLLNFTMIPEALGAQPALGLYWTLTTELVFYALCAALFVANLLHRPVALVVLSVVAGWFFKHYHADPAGLWGVHLSVMLFGALCRHYVESAPGSSARTMLGLWVLAYATGWAMLPFSGVWGMQPGVWEGDAFTTLRTYATGVVVFTLGVTWLQIRWRPAAWVGRISYSLYLFHPVVLFVSLWLLLRWAPAWMYGHHLSFYMLWVLAVSIVVAAFIYRMVEQPAIRWGKVLSQRVSTAYLPAPHMVLPLESVAPLKR